MNTHTRKKIIGTATTLLILAVGGISGISHSNVNHGLNSKLSILNVFNKNRSVTIKNSESDNDLLNIKFDANKYPQNYVIINDNKPSFNDKTVDLYNAKSSQTKESWFEYGNLDGLGRTLTATALVDYDSMYNHSSKVTERPPFPSATKVSGEDIGASYDAASQQWRGGISNNKKVQLSNYRGYLYNKSHLIAWSLGGDMNTHNVVLGTRAQNVGTNNSKNAGGMAYTETTVRNYLYDHREARILYQATPVYKDNELVPRGVHVMAKSMNDDGKGISLNVWTFNYQDGVNIDYNTGKAL